MPVAVPPVPVVAAEGNRLRLADGREPVDGMSSWWAAIHGYRHPVLDAAVETQLAEMAHVLFGGITHPTAIDLAELLRWYPLPLAPPMAADRLGLPPIHLDDLVSELGWPDGVQVGLVETAGVAGSPIAHDGDGADWRAGCPPRWPSSSPTPDSARSTRYGWRSTRCRRSPLSWCSTATTEATGCTSPTGSGWSSAMAVAVVTDVAELAAHPLLGAPSAQVSLG